MGHFPCYLIILACTVAASAATAANAGTNPHTNTDDAHKTIENLETQLRHQAAVHDDAVRTLEQQLSAARAQARDEVVGALEEQLLRQAQAHDEAIEVLAYLRG